VHVRQLPSWRISGSTPRGEAVPLGGAVQPQRAWRPEVRVHGWSSAAVESMAARGESA
jgi:hypothetical protein